MQPTTADGRRNILTDIKRDHEHMKGMYRQMKDSMTTDEQKQQLAWQIIHDLTVHSLAEEEVLYPAMTSVMGTETRDHALSEHKTMKDILSDLDAMTISTPGFNDKMHILMVVRILLMFTSMLQCLTGCCYTCWVSEALGVTQHKHVRADAGELLYPCTQARCVTVSQFLSEVPGMACRPYTVVLPQ
eukprot:GHUV01023036.1.p1 GENE.GHUV01023036.1~~GHUV01023036.1.p1  ORF type:complete len:187 (+),score=43.41 GHUV01023036.1:574-1134(+)